MRELGAAYRDKAVDCVKSPVQHDPDLDPLRTQPRFQALVAAL